MNASTSRRAVARERHNAGLLIAVAIGRDCVLHCDPGVQPLDGSTVVCESDGGRMVGEYHSMAGGAFAIKVTGDGCTMSSGADGLRVVATVVGRTTWDAAETHSEVAAAGTQQARTAQKGGAA